MGASSEIEGSTYQKNPTFSSLLGFRTKVSPSSIDIQKPEDRKFLQPGLKTLIYAQERSLPRHIVHSTASFRPPNLACNSIIQSLSLSRSADIDDVLGSESGVYLSSTNLETEPNSGSSDRDRGKRNRPCESTRKFPPPIPLLARTGNLPGHMPWVLTRHCSDGRLILKEERVKHHEYFEARRENGRLVLTLVQLDDAISCHGLCEDSPEEEQLMEDRSFEAEGGESETEEGNGEMYVADNYIGNLNLYCNSAAAPEHMIGNLTQSSTPLVACSLAWSRRQRRMPRRCDGDFRLYYQTIVEFDGSPQIFFCFVI